MQLPCPIANYDIVQFRFVSELSRIVGKGFLDKGVVQFVLHQVDGASTKAAAHDARAGNAAFLSNVVQEI